LRHKQPSLAAAGGANVITWVPSPSYPPNPVFSSVEVGASNCRSTHPTLCHARGRADTGRVTVRHRLYRHPKPLRRNHREGYFLNSDVQRAIIDQERRDNIIQNYVKDTTLPMSMSRPRTSSLMTCDSRLIRRASSSRRSSRIRRIIPNSAGSDGRPRHLENVKNNELAVNPLGLTIVRFRADQAFS